MRIGTLSLTVVRVHQRLAAQRNTVTSVSVNNAPLPSSSFAYNGAAALLRSASLFPARTAALSALPPALSVTVDLDFAAAFTITWQ